MRVLKVAFLVLAVIAAIVTVSAVGATGIGSVSVIPASSNVPPGGTADIVVSIDPPLGGTSIWIVEIPYNPAVVEVIGCTTPPSPPDPTPPFAYAAGCDTKDTDNDAVHDTAVAFGGYVRNDNGVARGLETTFSAATFTFMAIGPAGSTSPLHVMVTAMLSPNGVDQAPATTDGVINVVAAATGRTPAVNPHGVCIQMPNNSDIIRHPEKHPDWTVGGC